VHGEKKKKCPDWVLDSMNRRKAEIGRDEAVRIHSTVSKRPQRTHEKKKRRSGEGRVNISYMHATGWNPGEDGKGVRRSANLKAGTREQVGGRDRKKSIVRKGKKGVGQEGLRE